MKTTNAKQKHKRNGSGRNSSNTSQHRKKCALCSRTLVSSNPYRYFCGLCRSQNELYRFAEWLQESGSPHGGFAKDGSEAA